MDLFPTPEQELLANSAREFAARVSGDLVRALEASETGYDDAHWRTGIKGKDYSEPEKLGGYLKKEADATRGLDPKNPQVSELKVMIRADRSAPYGLAQRAMNTCAKAGIYKVEVGAARPMDEKKHRG